MELDGFGGNMGPGHLSVTFDVEPIVKVLCNELDCANNLHSDTQGGWNACNLKHIVIGRSGICTSLRLTTASTVTAAPVDSAASDVDDGAAAGEPNR
jgi:hypothetical protein